MDDLTRQLKDELLCHGADLVGVGDLSEIPEKDRQGMLYGVSVAVAYSTEVIKGIAEKPTLEYYKEYEQLNEKLDMLVCLGADFLHIFGYKALPQTLAEVSKNETDYSSVLPHKTVATRGGIGWIGKCALLITKEYGSAIRISTILTDAPLKPNKTINESKCGDCLICTNSYPAEAVLGKNWNVNIIREEFYDAVKCRETARQRAMESIGIDITQCGKCVYVCPYTQKYIKNLIFIK